MLVVLYIYTLLYTSISCAKSTYRSSRGKPHSVSASARCGRIDHPWLGRKCRGNWTGSKVKLPPDKLINPGTSGVSISRTVIQPNQKVTFMNSGARRKSASETVLIVLLRASGILLLTALIPAVMPFAWMQEIHRQLGLGERFHGADHGLSDTLVVGHVCGPRGAGVLRLP